MPMRSRISVLTSLVAALGLTASLLAQGPAPAWRGAGPTPCVGPDGGIFTCATTPASTAIRAGRLFDSKAGLIRARQVVLLSGERITAVGPESEVRIPAGTSVLDLSQMTVLPGLIDAHTHMFNTRTARMTTETAMLIAVQNLQADLRAGFTAA